MMKRNQFIMSQLLLRSSSSSSQVQTPLQSLIQSCHHISQDMSFPKTTTIITTTTPPFIPLSKVTFPQTLIPTIENPTRSTISKIPIPRKPTSSVFLSTQ